MSVMIGQRTSLRKLQEIDKNHQSVAEQISALQALISNGQTGSGSSRAQWALRWLLRRFQLKDEIGLQARTLPAAWDLFSVLLRKIPTSAIAHILQQQQFLSSLATALEDCHGEADAVLEQFSQSGIGSSSCQDEHPDGTFNEPFNQGINSKRKQGSEVVCAFKKRKLSDSRSNTKPIQQNSAAHVIQPIVRVLQKLSGACSTSKDASSATSRAFLKSVVRPEHNVAQRMLLGGLEALESLMACSSAVEDITSPNIVECFTSFLSIWERKKYPDEQSDESFKVSFELRAIGQALVCARIAQERVGNISTDIHAIEQLKIFVDSIMHFVAKYGLMPSKTRFSLLDLNDRVARARFPVEDATWNRFPFEPASELYNAERSVSLASDKLLSRTSIEYQAQADVMFLECALSCSNLQSPKKRARDMPWLRMLFCKAFALYLQDTSNMLAATEIHLDSVRQVIDLSRSYNITFDDKALATYLLQLANARSVGVAELNDQAIHWDIVDGVVALFPQWMVPSQRQKLDNSGAQALSYPIFTCITSRMWYDSLLGPANGLSAQQASYNFVKTTLVPRLVRSFQTSRAHTEFLSAWHEQLSDVQAERSKNTDDRHARSHLWEDPGTVSIIATELISTMPLQLKLSAIDSLTSDEPAQPAFTVLEAILRAPTTQSFLEDLSGKMGSIISRSILLLGADSTTHAAIVYWRVLANALRTWISIAPAHKLELMTKPQDGQAAGIHLERVVHHVTTVLQRIQEATFSPQTLQSDDYRIAALAVTCLGTILQACADRKVQLEKSETLKPKIDIVLELIIQIFTSSDAFSSSTAMVDALNFFPSLGTEFSAFNQLRKNILKETRVPVTTSLFSHDIDETRVKLHEDRLQNNQILTLKQSCQDMRNRSMHELLLEMGRAVDGLPLEIRLRTLYEVLPPDVQGVDSSSLRLLHCILLSCGDWGEHTNMSPALVTLSQCVSATTSCAMLNMCCSGIAHILQLRKVHLTQNAVESILAAIGKLLSPSGPFFKRKHVRGIYKRLCHLIHILLTRNAFRKRLRGRAHVLVPVLQALLRCLFVPLSPSPSLAIQHPPWIAKTYAKAVASNLDEKGVKESKGLGVESATDFARLLSLLADPPLSSVSSASASRNKPSAGGSAEPLTDPTARARTYASYFAPLLVGEYANCLLRGRYCAEEVRKALQPGMWSLLDVIQRNGAGLDTLGSMTGRAEGARDVFRNVVSEWKRLPGNVRSGPYMATKAR